MDYTFSNHARQKLTEFGRSQIRLDWIERTLSNPDYVEKYEDQNKTYHWKRINEYGNRALKVVYNHNKKPVHIITVYFDKRYNK